MTKTSPQGAAASAPPTRSVNQRSATATDEYVGARVRFRRLELGFSLEYLADELGITFQQVQKYERGANRIGASRLHHLALVLQVPIAYFFDGGPAGPDTEWCNGSQVASPVAQALRDPATVHLVRSFASISDPRLKQKALSIIDAIAQTALAASDQPQPPADTAGPHTDDFLGTERLASVSQSS